MVFIVQTGNVLLVQAGVQGVEVLRLVQPGVQVVVVISCQTGVRVVVVILVQTGDRVVITISLHIGPRVGSVPVKGPVI